MSKGEMITAVGVLYPIFEDHADKLTGVMLSATDDKEYVIDGDRFINEFMSLCQEEVRVKGRRSFRDGQWHLMPHDYEIAIRDYFDPSPRDLDFEDSFLDDELYP